MTSLGTALSNASGHRTKWNGGHVYSLLQLTAQEGDRIEVTRVSSSRTRAQALKLSADRGELRANGVLVPTVAIWSHTAPEKVTLEVVGRRVRSVDIWNAWSLDGVDSAWIGNAAMIVEEPQSDVRLLRCSDGLGEPSFDDLVMQLRVVSSA